VRSTDCVNWVPELNGVTVAHFGANCWEKLARTIGLVLPYGVLRRFRA
jgi:hypothetical protein